MKSEDELPCVREDRGDLRPVGATSAGDGEPLPGAEKKTEATRQRSAGATSTLDWEPLFGAEKTEASNSDLPIYPDLVSHSVPKTSIT